MQRRAAACVGQTLYIPIFFASAALSICPTLYILYLYIGQTLYIPIFFASAALYSWIVPSYLRTAVAAVCM